MDEDHFLTAMRYVELNPVRAGLAASPVHWPWSSARAHLTGEPDPLMGDVREMIAYVGDWQHYFALNVEETALLRPRRHTRTGRPLGSDAFIHRRDAENAGRRFMDCELSSILSAERAAKSESVPKTPAKHLENHRRSQFWQC